MSRYKRWKSAEQQVVKAFKEAGWFIFTRERNECQ